MEQCLKMRNILITGAAGFIGSHVFDLLTEVYPDATITILDKMTYAADIENIKHNLENYKRKLVVGDVCDQELCLRLTKNQDCIIHLAAESHVDNSFHSSINFTRSNTLGTHTLLEAARENNVKLFIHVSTDEVYGEQLEGEALEGDLLCPSNPYSASKAAAEMIVNSYILSFNMPIITVRANNIYGYRQFPEKIIPKFILKAIKKEKLTIHGSGENTRHYLMAQDFAKAILTLINKGKCGECYNIGTEDEYKNMEIAGLICQHFGLPLKDNLINIENRPFNDFRYSVNCDKLLNLGWKPAYQFKETLPKVIDWYEKNIHRYYNLVL
jgi:UDP-glucose 4,6-dehydratase